MYGPVDVLGNREGAGIGVHRTGDAVGHDRSDQRVGPRRDGAGDGDGRDDVGAVGRDAVRLERPERQQHRVDALGHDLAELHPVHALDFTSARSLSSGRARRGNDGERRQRDGNRTKRHRGSPKERR